MCKTGTVLQVEDKTVAGLLGLIEADRNGETVDKTLLKHLVGMFTSLGTYGSAFEEAFLEKTKQYYSLEGQHFMQESDVADYLLHCEVWVLSVCLFVCLPACLPVWLSACLSVCLPVWASWLLGS